jgi:hypothetical protein
VVSCQWSVEEQWFLATDHSSFAFLDFMLGVLAEARRELGHRFFGVEFFRIDGDPIIQIAGFRALEPDPFPCHSWFPWLKAAGRTDSSQRIILAESGRFWETAPIFVK